MSDSHFGMMSTTPPPASMVRAPLVRAAAAVLGLVVVTPIVVLLLLQVGPAGRAVAGMALERAPYVTEASVDHVGGTWLTGVDLHGVRIAAADRGMTVSVDSVRVRWALLPLLRRHVSLGRLEIAGPHLIWDACTPVPESGPAATSAWTVSVGTLTVTDGSTDGTSCAEPEPASFAASDVALSATDVQLGDRTAAASVSLAASLRPPGTPVDYLARVDVGAQLRDGLLTIDTLTVRSPHSDVRGSGTLAFGGPAADATELRLIAAPFDFRDLQPYAGRWVVAEGSAEAELTVRRTPGGTNILGSLAVRDGGRATYDVSWTPVQDSGVAYRASIRAERLDPSRLLTGGPAGAFDGSFEGRVEGARLASADGRITLDLRDGGVPATDRSGSLTLDLREGAGDLDAELSWLGWRAEVDGTVHPFAASPAYDLIAEIEAPRPAAIQQAGVTTPLQGRLSVAGTGITATEAALTARLLLDRFDMGRETVGPTVFDARVDSGTAGLEAQGPAGGGRLTAAGRVSLGTRPAIDLRDMVLAGVDVAGLLADPTPSRVDLIIRGDASGDGWRELVGRFHVSSDAISYGRITVDSLDVAGALEHGRVVSASARVESNAGSADADIGVDPGAPLASVRISNGRMSRVDIGAFRADSTWTTELTGRFDGQLERRAGDRPDGREARTDFAGNGRITLSESRIGTQAVDGGDVGFTLEDSRVRLTTELRFPDGSVAVRGSASPFDSIRTMSIDTLDARGLDLSAMLGSAKWPGPFDGTLVAHARGRDLATLTGDLDVVVRQAIVGETRLASSRMSGQAADGRLRVDGHLAGPWGQADVRGETGTTAAARGFDLSGTFTVSRLQDLLGDSAWTGDISGSFSVEGDNLVPVGGGPFSADSVRAHGRAYAAAGTLRDVPFDSVALVASIDRGLVRLDTTSAWSPGGSLHAEGTFPLTPAAGGVADLRVESRALDIGPMASWLDLDLLSADSASFTASASGPRDSLVVGVDVRVLALVADDMRADRLSGSARATVRPDGSLTALSSDVRVRHARAGSVDFDSTDVRLIMSDGQYRIDLESLVDRRRHVRLMGGFDPTGNGVHIERLDLSVDSDRWTLESDARIALGSAPRVDQLVLTAGAQRIEVRGGIDSGGVQDLTADVTDVRVASIADLLGWETLDGTLDGTLALTGPASNPDARVTLDADLTDRGTAIGILSVDAAVQDRRLTVDAGIARPQGSGQITLRGDAPLSLTLPDSTLAGGVVEVPDGPIDLALSADSFALEWLTPFLDPAFFTDPGGRLTADVRALGTVQDPEMSGGMSLDGGRLRLVELGVGFTEGRFAAAVEGNQIRLDSVSVRSGEGTLKSSGVVTFERLVDPQLDLAVRLDRFDGIRNQRAQAALSGELTVKGAPLRPVVAGTLDVPSTEVNLDAQWSSPDVGNVELTEDDLRMLEETFGVRPGDEPPRRGLYEAADLSLQVVLGRDTWARQRSNPEMALQFSGELSVEKRPDALLQVSGTLLAVPGRSYIRQFGRRFQVASGEVDFTGPLSDARVDLTADYAVSSRDNPGVPEVTISLAVQGTAETMSLVLSSDPSMENADIVSYIATGRPASEGFAGAGGSQGALVDAGTAVARDQLVGIVQRGLMDVSGFEVFEIRSDGANGTSLVAGSYISPRLYVGIVQPISSGGTDQAAANTTNSRAIEIEYEAFRWLILNLQRGGSRLGFFLKSRYAY